ncbi:hypothetical protein [Acinetobacter gerneri]|uniref:Uncharacterized protein n=1 Tax=Acinetobacter gerneri DSM 14967 = CIP 107464 = MTCC 9824 TaxID=1120926 RepID=N8ZVP0_9GAMM|nr:hypothetical protein [Acinetobacter gerneri]ENV35530.1 hypothetical protein F960_00212 [Acinetobacter gerneri DSM 14967 = CIP 107464 = MTCC 9824]EPR81155.1 hypothetical protein L289_3980 [Acinetobacter gerneri DSM 14967 = CIP 107464 = MTCC 9824]
MILDLFLPKKEAPNDKYLLNPYFQLTSWLLYKMYDAESGERLKNLLIELKELLLSFDKVNKTHFNENFDNWSPYNIWMDIAISKYINPYIDTLKERIFLKRNHPNQFYSFYIDFYTFTRMVQEKELLFAPAFLDKISKIEYDKITKKVLDFDWFLKLGDPRDNGLGIDTALNYIADHKQREKGVLNDVLFEEPEIYPTYLISPKKFKVNDKIELNGVYIPDNPLKASKVFSNTSLEQFYKSSIYSIDIPKLKSPVNSVQGYIEYGLYDIYSEYYNNPVDPIDVFKYINKTEIATDWYFVKEIPPNTEGIPNNPLRLEDLRYPLKQGEKYISLDEIKQRDEYVYDNPNAMVENYGQVAYRYEKYYRDYLLKNGVNEDDLMPYQNVKK